MYKKATMDSVHLELEANKTLKQVRSKAIKPVSNKPVNIVSKEKATFNLSKQLLQDLESIWFDIRKARQDKHVTKTDIVELAIFHLLADHKARKQESKLSSLINSNKTIKQ